MAETESSIASLARSGRMRIAAALLVTALVGGGLGVIMLRGGEAGQALLFSGLELEEAADITDRLDTANIDYKLEGGGSSIFVNRANVDGARMMLAEQGLPTRGSVGWEIFDKTDALGATSFVQNINKVRAQEGELARTIASLDMVKAARVHLVLPEKTLFKEDAEKASASVTVGLSGRSLTPDKVRAIRNLVASSVPGLSVNAITVIDDKGRMLAAGSDDDEFGAGGVGADERKLSMENDYRRKILDVVENIAGIGAARVQVSLDVDFNRITQSAETFDPDGRVVRSQTTMENTSSNTESEPRDTVTAANNTPDGQADEATPQATNRSETSDLSETINYEISKNTRTEIIEGGRLQRLSVAVAVDHKRVITTVEPPEPAEGEEQTETASTVQSFEPRTEEELALILNLVRSAVGFDEARGDIVTVENIPFARPDSSLSDVKAPGPFDFDKFDIVRGVEIGALLVTALALVFFVLRPLVSGLMSKDQDGTGIPSLTPGGTTAALGAGGAASLGAPPTVAGVPEMPGMDGIELSQQTDPGIDVARISGQVKASSIRKMSEVVASHPDESVSIIRSWLSEPTREGTG